MAGRVTVVVLAMAAAAMTSSRPGDSDFLTEQVPAVKGSYDRYTLTINHPKKLFTDMWSDNLRQLQYDATKIRETTGIEMSPYSALETEEVANQITNDIVRLADVDSQTWTFTSKKGVAVGVRYNGHLLPLPNIPNFDKAMEVLGQQSQFQVRGPLRMNAEGEDGTDLKTLSLEVETAEHDDAHHGVTVLKDGNTEPPPENVATSDMMMAAERRDGVNDPLEFNDLEAATKPGAILTGIAVVAIVGILITAMVQMGNSNFGLGIVLILLAVSLAVDVWHIWQMPPTSMSLNAPPPADAQKNLNAKSTTQSTKDEQAKKDVTPSDNSKTVSLEADKQPAIEGREAAATSLEDSLQDHTAEHERVGSKDFKKATGGSDGGVDSWLSLVGMDAPLAASASDSVSSTVATETAEQKPAATEQQQQQAPESPSSEVDAAASVPSMEALQQQVSTHPVGSRQPFNDSQLEVQTVDMVVLAALTAAKNALKKEGPDSALAAAATAARAAGAPPGSVAKIVGQVARKLFETDTPEQDASTGPASSSPSESGSGQAQAANIEIGTTRTPTQHKRKVHTGPKHHNRKNNGKQRTKSKQAAIEGGNLESEWAKQLL